MDWNRNGSIDASDLFTTELFEEELKRDRMLKIKQNSDSSNEENAEDSEK